MGRRNVALDKGWDNFAVALGVNLHKARIAAEMTQEAVAYRAGLTRYTYQKYEKGESVTGAPANPTLRTLLALSQALDVPLLELLPGGAPDLLAR